MLALDRAIGLGRLTSAQLGQGWDERRAEAVSGGDQRGIRLRETEVSFGDEEQDSSVAVVRASRRSSAAAMERRR